jgi:hypothetical protein
LPYLAFPQENEKLAFVPLVEPKVERHIGMLTRKGAACHLWQGTDGVSASAVGEG